MEENLLTIFSIQSRLLGQRLTLDWRGGCAGSSMRKKKVLLLMRNGIYIGWWLTE